MSRSDGVRTFPVAGGVLTLRRDADHASAWLLEVGSTRQSHVDLADPTRLTFAYIRRIAHVVDLTAPPRDALDVVHLGGGGLTLPRYIAATRPGSRQRVFETDEQLTQVVRTELPLQRGWQIRVRTVDALEGLTTLRSGSADVVIMDVFHEGRIPQHLTDLRVVTEAARVLRPGGRYVVNVVDRRPLGLARTQVANVQQVWTDVAAIVEPAVVNGRGSGNIVLVAPTAGLHLDELSARVVADRQPARVLSGDEVDRFRGGAPAAPAPSGAGRRSRE